MFTAGRPRRLELKGWLGDLAGDRAAARSSAMDRSQPANNAGYDRLEASRARPKR